MISRRLSRSPLFTDCLWTVEGLPAALRTAGECVSVARGAISNRGGGGVFQEGVVFFFLFVELRGMFY